MRLARRQEIRTVRDRIELAAPFDGVQQQLAERIADRLAHVGREVGIEVRHDRLDAAGCLARARHDELDPVGPRRDHFDRRRVGAASASRTVCSSAGASTGLCTYLNACSRTAFSSVSGASSDVITTTRGRASIVAELREEIQPVHPRHPHVEQQQVELLERERLERLDAVLGHRRRKPGLGQDRPQHVTRGLVVVDHEDLAHDGLRFRLARGVRWRGGRPPLPGARCEPRANASSSRASSWRSVTARALGAPSKFRVPSRLLDLPRRAWRPAGAPTVAIAPFSPCAASRSASASRRSSARSIWRSDDGESGPKQRDDLLQEPAIAARVAERRAFVERSRRSSAASGDWSRRGGCAAAASEPLDGRDQLVDVDWLRQIAVHAGFQAALAIALHGVSGQRDERQRAGAASASPLADRLRRLEPAHLRHLQVHQHDVERRVPADSTASTATRPFSTASTLWPRFLSSVVTSLRFTGLSSATSTCSGRARSRADRSTAGSVRPSLRRDAEQPRERIEQIGVLDRLGQERIDAVPVRAAPDRRTARPRSASRSASSRARRAF